MTYGYTHGWGDCQLCFPSGNRPALPKNWELHNNPGYAGSPNPRILVLGFSKGANQNEMAKLGDYDQVPFAKMRPRLQRVLTVLGLMPLDRSIDAMLTADEKEFGMASLVRCSLCRMEGRGCKTSGALVTDGFHLEEIKKIIFRCAATYLASPPESLQRVILLGTNTLYIQSTMELFKSLYPDFQIKNEVAFEARGILWVYAAHPSRASTSLGDWEKAQPDNRSGRKCLWAKQALATLPH